MDFPQDEKLTDDMDEITWDASLAGKYVCHGKASAQAVFEANPENYLSTLSCYVGEDGILRVGIKMSGVTWNAAWAVFDNFQVTYLGADDMSGSQVCFGCTDSGCKRYVGSRIINYSGCQGWAEQGY